MKYFDELDQVDTQVVRLAEMKNLLSVIANGIDSSSPEEVVSAFHYIEGSVRDISEQLSDGFRQLFDAIAQDKQ